MDVDGRCVALLVRPEGQEHYVLVCVQRAQLGLYPGYRLVRVVQRQLCQAALPVLEVCYESR